MKRADKQALKRLISLRRGENGAASIALLAEYLEGATTEQRSAFVESARAGIDQRLPHFETRTAQLITDGSRFGATFVRSLLTQSRHVVNYGFLGERRGDLLTLDVLHLLPNTLRLMSTKNHPVELASMGSTAVKGRAVEPVKRLDVTLRVMTGNDGQAFQRGDKIDFWRVELDGIQHLPLNAATFGESHNEFRLPRQHRFFALGANDPLISVVQIDCAAYDPSWRRDFSYRVHLHDDERVTIHAGGDSPMTFTDEELQEESVYYDNLRGLELRIPEPKSFMPDR